MFVTSPAFELHMPQGLGLPGQRFWRSIGFALNAPWLIVSVAYDDENDDQALCQDMLMASDAELKEVLDDIGSDSVISVHFVEPPSYSATGTWRMRKVTKVWRTAKQSGAPGSALAFEDEQGRFACPLDDADLNQVTELVREFAKRA